MSMSSRIKVLTASGVSAIEKLLSELTEEDTVLAYSIDQNGNHYVIVRISSRV